MYSRIARVWSTVFIFFSTGTTLRDCVRFGFVPLQCPDMSLVERTAFHLCTYVVARRRLLTTLTALSKRFGWVSWLVYPFFEIVSFLPYFDHRARKGCHNRGEFFCHVRVVLSSHIDIVQLWRTSLLDLGAFACVWRRLYSFISP